MWTFLSTGKRRELAENQILIKISKHVCLRGTHHRQAQSAIWSDLDVSVGLGEAPSAPCWKMKILVKAMLGGRWRSQIFADCWKSKQRRENAISRELPGAQRISKAQWRSGTSGSSNECRLSNNGRGMQSLCPRKSSVGHLSVSKNLTEGQGAQKSISVFRRA